ncbi:ROK family transcriptional regulator [Pseudoalteromonas haloplanktis]|uniref:ROK family transcriptional regulator n=1 Tax=Pseudoalteromonas haloplanktis TaxID=228 RepID=A0ABU1BHH7_PSEHA|nr:ROK family transcriptional regulator [Pseudoalteromonas haloplanktis]MDQ9093211.1 ROK family transcriptional regulator [Pseudoalteromonas haloplanktis]
MQGSNSKQNKAINLRLVLSQIVTEGPISRVEISRNTHLTKQTITNMVDQLLAVGLINELGVKKEGSVGKPSQMLMLNKAAAYTLAFKVAENEIEVGIFCLDGACLNQLAMPYHTDELIKQSCFLVDTLLTASQITKSQILGVGLTFTYAQQPSIEKYQFGKAMQSKLSDALHLPVALETTAAACAAYQMLFGEAKRLHSFVYVHIGDTIDAAIVNDRKVLLGQNGLTGAIGELFVTPETNGDTAELGRLNDFASLHSLKTFFGHEPQSPSELTRNVMLNSAKLEQWLDNAAEPMRIAIHTLESLLNCQTIIIGSDLNSEFLERFIKKLRPFIPSISQFGERQVVRLIKSPDTEQIALKGAATLPLHAALNNVNMQTLHLKPAATATDIQALIYNLSINE